MNIRTIIAVILGLVLTIFFVVFFMRSISEDILKSLFHIVNIPILMLAIIVQASILWIRSLRWRFLTYPSSLPIKPFFEATTISFLVTTILPGRIGEAIRPYVLFKRSNLPLSKSIVSALYERWMDLIALLVFACIFAILEGESISVVSGASLIGVIIIIITGLAGAIWAILANRKNNKNNGSFMGKILNDVHGSMDFWRHPKIWGSGIAWSIVIWIVAGFALFLASLSFNISLNMSSTILLVLLVAFGSALPTPAGIGGVQVAFVVVFSLIGIDKDRSLAIGLLCHGALASPTLILGLILLFSGRVSIRSLLFNKTVS